MNRIATICLFWLLPSLGCYTYAAETPGDGSIPVQLHHPASSTPVESASGKLSYGQPALWIAGARSRHDIGSLPQMLPTDKGRLLLDEQGLRYTERIGDRASELVTIPYERIASVRAESEREFALLVVTLTERSVGNPISHLFLILHTGSVEAGVFAREAKAQIENRIPKEPRGLAEAMATTIEAPSKTEPKAVKAAREEEIPTPEAAVIVSAEGQPVLMNETDRGALAQVSVAAAPGVPDVYLAVFALDDNLSNRRAAAGAEMGAGLGAIAGLYAGLQTCLPLMFTPAAPACSALGLIIAGTVIGAGVGGVAGSVADTAAPRTGFHEPLPDRLATGPAIQAAFRKRVATHALKEASLQFVEITQTGEQISDLRGAALRTGESDAVLQVEIVRIIMPRSPRDLRLETVARATLTRKGDGQVLADATYRAESPPWPREKWTAEDALLIGRTLEKSYEALAEEIVQDLFLLPPDSRPQRKRNPVAESAFAETDPAVVVLRWNTFPNPRDREADMAGALAGARNVSYELRVYQALQTSGGWIPGALAYARDGLSATSHRVESPLEPCARYFWTYRARFELDSRKRATAWSTGGHGTSEEPSAGAALDPLSRILSGVAGLVRGVVDVLSISSTTYPAFRTACAIDNQRSVNDLPGTDDRTQSYGTSPQQSPGLNRS